MMRILLPILLLLLARPCAAQIRVDTLAEGGARVQVVRVDLARAEVRLLWKDEAGTPFRSTRGVERWAGAKGLRLLAVANAGIFDPDSTPTGLHVERGRVLDALNLRRGRGNFYLLPNAVFAILRDGTARIVASRDARGLRITEGTQSGPALLLRGRIHHRFSPSKGTPLNRNAVGVCGPREVVLARTVDDTGITFYEMARLFKDRLGCPDALFLDGNNTTLHLPGAAPRHGTGFVGFIGVFARP